MPPQDSADPSSPLEEEKLFSFSSMLVTDIWTSLPGDVLAELLSIKYIVVNFCSAESHTCQARTL